MIPRFLGFTLRFLGVLAIWCLTALLGVTIGVGCARFGVHPAVFLGGLTLFLLGCFAYLGPLKSFAPLPGATRLKQTLASVGVKACYFIAIFAFKVARVLAISGDLYTSMRLELNTYEPDEAQAAEPEPEPKPSKFCGRIFDPEEMAYGCKTPVDLPDIEAPGGPKWRPFEKLPAYTHDPIVSEYLGATA